MVDDIPQSKLPVSAGTVFDPGQQHLSEVYAKGLLGATEKAGNTEVVLEEFDSLLEDVFTRLPNLEDVLASPRVNHAAKERILNQAFQGKMTRQLLNFLKVMSKRGRLGMIRPIHAATHEQYNQLRGRVKVRVRSAHPLDAPSLTNLTARLREAMHCEVQLTTSVDADLIGGLVIRVGDTVYDASIANRLRRMRKDTVTKTSQVIRQALERFVVDAPTVT